jgi:hypothetical protein
MDERREIFKIEVEPGMYFITFWFGGIKWYQTNWSLKQSELGGAA